MLNQFLRVKKLSKRAKQLVDERKIDSVDLVHNLAKFPLSEQDFIVDLILQNKLKVLDIRFLNPLRKAYPEVSIDQLIDRLKKSENLKLSVIQFPKNLLSGDLNKSREAFEHIIGKEELADLIILDEIVELKVTKLGEKKLRAAAKRNKKSLKDFTYSILKNETRS